MIYLIGAIIFIVILIYLFSDKKRYIECQSCDKELFETNCEIHSCSKCNVSWCKSCFTENGVASEYFYYEFVCGNSSICKKCSVLTNEKCYKCSIELNENMEINSCSKCGLSWCKYCFSNTHDDNLNFDFVHGITNICKQCKEPHINQNKMDKVRCFKCTNNSISNEVYQCYKCCKTYCKYHYKKLKFKNRNNIEWKGTCNFCMKN